MLGLRDRVQLGHGATTVGGTRVWGSLRFSRLRIGEVHGRGSSHQNHHHC